MHRARPWIVAVLLMLAFALSFIDRQILAFMVGPIRRDLGISDTEMSLLMGFSFALVYAVATLPMGRLADTGNRRNLIVWGVVFWSLMTAACGLAKNYTQLFLARVGVGAGEAALQPAAYSLIAASFAPERRALALSLCAAGVYVGSGVAYMLGGLLAQFVATHPRVELPMVSAVIGPAIGTVFGWQATLLGLGVAGLGFALLLLVIREPAREPGSAPPPPVRAVAAHLWARRGTLVPHHLGFALLLLCSYGTGAWVPAYFARVHGFSMAEIGLMVGMGSVVFGTLGMLLGGALYDRWQHQLGPAAVYRVGQWSAALVLPFAGLYMLSSSPLWAAVWVMPAIFGISMTVGAAPASVQQMMPERLRGQATAVYLFVVNLIGLGLGPTSVALLTDHVFEHDHAVGRSMFVVTVLALLGAALCFAVAAQRERKSAARD